MRKAVLFISLLSLIILNFSCNSGNNKQKTDGLSGDLIIFHAGSLSIPFKLIAEEFEKENPEVNVLLESAGSVACARKITDLKKDCDIMASADYQVIDRFLIPEYADWNISFAANEMVIAFTDKSRMADKITQDNWFEILASPNIIFGRSDPNSDPCGYRSVMTTQLVARVENNPAILELLEKDKNFIRPKEVDLLGLLEANAIDYIFIYKSVASQHHLNYITLSDSVNLSKPELKDWYAQTQVDIFGKKPGEFLKLTGSPMVYGICTLKNAPNKAVANAFMEFFLNPDKGMKIVQSQGQSSVIPSVSSSYDQIPDLFKAYSRPLASRTN